MSASSEVLLEVRGQVQWITLNRPDRRSALNAQVIARLVEGLHLAQSTSDIGAIVLTGCSEAAFCAGADLSVGTGTFGQDFANPNQPLADLLRQARACRLPIIGRINGACMASGMGLWGMCDMAVAASDAPFGLPEVKVGVFPMHILSVLLPLVARRHLVEMCITGETISADHALQIGLLNYVVPRDALDAKVDWLLARVLDKSPTAIRRGKYAMEAVEDMTFAQRMAFTESMIGPTSLTRDAAEGAWAFVEKHKPVWTGA